MPLRQRKSDAEPFPREADRPIPCLPNRSSSRRLPLKVRTEKSEPALSAPNDQSAASCCVLACEKDTLATAAEPSRGTPVSEDSAAQSVTASRNPPSSRRLAGRASSVPESAMPGASSLVLCRLKRSAANCHSVEKRNGAPACSALMDASLSVAETSSVPLPPAAPTDGVLRRTRRPSSVAVSTPRCGLASVSSPPGESSGPEARSLSSSGPDREGAIPFNEDSARDKAASSFLPSVEAFPLPLS